MEEKELNEIIVVKQLPEIKEQLQLISDEVDKEINYALSLEVNEETVKEVKNVRARLNKINSTLEAKRKYVKEAILAPYNDFLEVYDNLVKNKLNEADSTLKMRINDIEDSQKKIKEVELRQFVEEHCKANNMDIPFEKIGLNITLSASMKSLKEQAKAFIERVASEAELIKQEEYSNEILMEYVQDFNYVNAKTKVLERHKQLDEIQRQQEGKDAVKQIAEDIAKNVEEAIEITAPVEIEDTETYQFEVKATKEQIKKLIDFMKELGVEYK